MQWKKPKNTDKYHWTQHVTEKMHHYGLSEQKVLGVIRKPFRTETGVAQDTVAVMVPVGNVRKNAKPSKWKRNFQAETEDAWSQEIWVMYQIKNHESRIKNQEKIKEQNLAKLRQILTSNKKIHNSKFINHNSANRKVCIISAWRYPGVSSEKDPIPVEIWREIEEMGLG